MFRAFKVAGASKDDDAAKWWNTTHQLQAHWATDDTQRLING